MPDVTAGKILVGDGASFEEVAVSGDVALASNGAMTIQADAVEQSMIADDAVGAAQLASDAVVNASIASGAAIDMDKLDGGSLAASLTDLAQGDLLYAGDVDASNALKSITFSDFEDAIFGNLSGDATVAAGGALTIANDAVEQAMIADDAVGADQLASDAVVNASVASGAAIALSKLESVSAARLIVGNGSNVPTAVDVTGDVTISNSGVTAIGATKVLGSMLNDDCISGQAEMTGGLADTDELLVSDAGVLKRADLSVLKGYFDSFSVKDCDDAAASLEVGLNFSSNAISQNRTWTLPDTSGLDVGDKIIVKAPLVSSGVLTIATQGSDKIDRVQTQVLLEEDDASITLIVSAAGHYVVI
jgi:hypothetical protein